TGQSQDDLRIEHARLEGDVAVDHPELKLKSRLLELTFDPDAQRHPRSQPASQPISPTNPAAVAVRQIIATDDVHGVMLGAASSAGENGQQTPSQQSIDCRRLVIDMAKVPDGRAYPSTVTADGSVVAAASDGELRAEHL